MHDKEELIEQIHKIANMAGVKGQREGDLLLFGWDFGGGRDQMCYVAPFSENDAGLNIVCFFSPCERLGRGFLGGVSKATALELLRINATLEFGHFAIMKLGDDEMICARATQILETMEVQEFEQKCLNVARLADAWEEKLGKDDF